MFSYLFASSPNQASSIVLIILLIVALILIAIFVPVFIAVRIHKRFVLSHSVALKELKELNNEYNDFKEILDFDMSHSYDNVDFYQLVSCEDYLTYQLVYIGGNVRKALNDVAWNRRKYDGYRKELGRIKLNRYDIDTGRKNKKLLALIEKKAIRKAALYPTTKFDIEVRLVQTKINNTYVRSKSNIFSEQEIKDILVKLSNKKGNYYCDNDVWQSICRVERGKVSNKMRFSIYERDGNRCRYCHTRGSRYNRLEIDHIIPIAKGGKSTYSNLQTLCHRCNVIKGSN